MLDPPVGLAFATRRAVFLGGLPQFHFPRGCATRFVVPRTQRVKTKKSSNLDDAGALWWPKLRRNLARLYDELAKERSPTQPEQATLALGVERGDHAFVADLRAATKADSPPWGDVGPEERETFKKANGGVELRKMIQVAFGSDVLGTSEEARAAVLRLVEWDLRYLWHPSMTLLLRNAQFADNRPFLQAVGRALWQNGRYGGRGQRKQRLLTRLLLQFQFGDHDAYRDAVHRERVRTGLVEAFQDAGVPAEHPAMQMLLDTEYFPTHVRRLREAARRNSPT